MANYTYDPVNLSEESVDRMRFELGDTVFQPGELTAALCDEEYLSILSRETDFKQAKIACLKAILMKYPHQVNTNVDGISYSFADRVNVWKNLLTELEKKTSTAVPVWDSSGLSGADGGHYFYKNMHANHRKGD